jgi:hypothetical protein
MTIVEKLVERLQENLGAAIVSITLYGSAAISAPQDEFSDYNVLCVLKAVTPKELAAVSETVRWWREKGYPAPVFFSEVELMRSTDCFAMEFEDMKLQRRVLVGSDPVASLVVDRKYYRARVEFEARSKLLRLRERASGVMDNQESLLKLMADSLSTFVVVMRHTMILAGEPAEFQKRLVFEKASQKFRMKVIPFQQLLEFRQGSLKLADIDVPALFADYLSQLELLVFAVDGL